MAPRFNGPGGTWAGGPSQSQRNFASNLQEHDALISSYEHLTGMPDPAEALTRLRKIASLVKPIMRKRGWHVNTLTEFLPDDARLLGLNINHGQKICVRLRYTHRPSSFLPIEQCVDTMLHELSHIVFGPHDAKFHALWDELRNEHETLLMRGYTGEGFLTKGQRLGGGRVPPPEELRRQARANAAQNRKSAGRDRANSGFRLGGRRILPGQDPRKTIADAIERRNTINRGCASGSAEADSLARQHSQRTITTRSDEDDANDRAIAEALLELMEEEEMQKLDPPEQGLTWTPEGGLAAVSSPSRSKSSEIVRNMSEEDQIKWALQESMKTQPATSTGHGRIRQRSLSPMPASTSRSSPRARSTSPYRPNHSDGTTDNTDDQRQLPSTLSIPTSSYSSTHRSPSGATGALSDLAGALSAASAPTWKEGVDRIRRKPTPPSIDTRATTSIAPHPTAPLPRLRTFSSPIDLTSNASGADALPAPPPSDEPEHPITWTCETCTCINPLQYLACDACGLERSASTTSMLMAKTKTQGSRSGSARGSSDTVRSGANAGPGVLDRSAAANLERVGRQGVTLSRPESMGWSCRRCATFMEHRYWTCSVCGLMKGDSRANEHVL